MSAASIPEQRLALCRVEEGQKGTEAPQSKKPRPLDLAASKVTPQAQAHLGQAALNDHH